jgi:triphosphatase
MDSSPTIEIELKFHVPPDRVAGVEHALRDRVRATRTHLQAAYYDTHDERLAAAGLAWRVRREGRRWVQTLKSSQANGDGMHREEHNVTIHTREWPVADPSLHADTPAGEKLAAVLKDIADDREPPPAERFRTDVWRIERTVRAPGGQVTISFDKGEIVAGDATTPVCELEVELRSGKPQAVIDTATKWVERHGLWLDAINKAQRGALLARGAELAPVVKAVPAELDAEWSIDAATREMVRACVVQIIRNTSALANDLGDHTHVHQARIGIRKLRTVLREFGKAIPVLDASWEPRLRDYFNQLGASRDLEVVAAMGPAIEAAGGPAIDVRSTSTVDPIAVARDPELTVLVLELFGYVHGQPVAPQSDGELIEAVASRLQKLHRRALKRHDRFPKLPEEERHAIRKRLKRLRYTAELSASLFPSKKVARYLRQITPAQEALGELNDLAVARNTFKSLSEHDPNAWFAAGWAAAQGPHAIAKCVKPLARAAEADRYWRD